MNPKANLATSRRNFLAGMRTLAAASVLIGAGLAGCTAQAQKNGNNGNHGNGSNGNGNSGNHRSGNGNNRNGNNGPRCFCSGTQIQTPVGAVNIEDLRIGDLVHTHSGRPEAVKWIWERRIENDASGEWPTGALPVRIAKGALGEGIPRRDLYLSQTHMLYLGGVLISAASLINGRTIAVVKPSTEVLEYYHIELESHGIVLAEGASCETLLATAKSRQSFDNYAEYKEHLRASPETAMIACAPIASFNGGRSEFKSRMRSAFAPVIDLRQPIDRVRDFVESRAFLDKAA